MAERGDDVLHARFGGEFHGGAAEAKARGAQPHLVHRLLAGNVDDPLAAPGKGGAGLDEERGLADTGLTAEEHHRSGDEAPAADAVEFGDAGGEACPRSLRLAERTKAEHATLPGLARGLRPDAGGTGFLHNRVPSAAGLAAPLPARREVAARLAHEGGAGLHHVAII